PESVIELGSSETTNARTRVTDLVAGLHAFVVKCLDTDGDRPLPNVDVQMLPLLGGEAHRGQTGSDGRLVLRELPAGIYHVALSHEAYLLQSSSLPRNRLVTVPEAPGITKWARAYAYGVRLHGGLVHPTFDTARKAGFEVVSTPLGNSYGELYQRIKATYAARDNEHIHLVCLRNVTAPPMMQVTA